MSRKFSLVVEPVAERSVVFYKEDGSRFANKHTIKLKLATEYCLRITLSPPLSLDCMKVMLNEDQNEKNLLSDCSAKELFRDQQKAVYLTTWNLANDDLPASKKSQRETIFLIFPLNIGEAKLGLQCKVYGEKSKSHQGGRRLNSIEQSLTINSDNTLDCGNLILS